MAPKRRDHGQGGLYELKGRGLWRGVIDDGYWPDGRRRQRYVHAKTREECVKKLRRLTQELDRGAAPLDHHTKVSQLAEIWLEDAGARLKPKTMQGYRSHVTSSIIPILGKRIIGDLKPSDVRRLHSAVFARGVGTSSVGGAHRTLSAMLAYAVAEGYITRNVAESVSIPTKVPSDRDSLTRAEAQALLDLQDPMWTLRLLCGPRDGEVRGLRIPDLDLENAMARISWNLTEVTSVHGCGGTCGFKTAGRCPQRKLDIAPNLEVVPLEGRWALVRPKAYRPRLTPLTDALVDQLRTHLQHDDAPNPHQLVWHRPGGLPLTNSDTNDMFRTALKKAGIDRDATTHWLRHTYTTMAEHAGIPWVVYSRISGHASEDVSRGYTHQLETESRAGIARLDSFLRHADSA